MIKKFLKIKIMILILILLTSVAYASTGTVTGNTVRIREKASSDSQAITVAQKGEKVEIIGEEGNWYHINFAKIAGYISKDYVVADDNLNAVNSTAVQENLEEQPSETITEENTDNSNTSDAPAETNTTAIISQNYEENQSITLKTNVDLRYLPNFSSRVKIIAETGNTYIVKASLNNWVKISNENGNGWVLKNLIDEDTTVSNIDTNIEQEVENNEVSTNNLEYSKGKVNVDSARLRKTPNGDVLDSIPNGTEVTILGEEADWYKIKTDKYDSCYIAKKLITEI